MSVTANFALQHFQSAILFRDKAAELESTHLREPFGPFFEEIRTYVSGCFMMSAATLEALINELFFCNVELKSRVSASGQRYWNTVSPRTRREARDGIESKAVIKKYEHAPSAARKFYP